MDDDQKSAEQLLEEIDTQLFSMLERSLIVMEQLVEMLAHQHQQNRRG